MTITDRLKGVVRGPFNRTYRRLGLLDARLRSVYLTQPGERKLHLGCGTNLLTGWLNTDLDPHRSARTTMHLDATRRFPFKDGTFDYVFSEHMIEHISYADGVRMLSECYRVLRSGGTVRISTPDLRFLIALAGEHLTTVQESYIKWATDAFVLPYADAVVVINNFVRDWGHTFIYDVPTLRTALAHAGFTDITQYELNRSDAVALRGLENEARMPAGFLRLETMTLEGTKR